MLVASPISGRGGPAQLEFQEFKLPNGKAGVASAVSSGDLLVMLHLDQTVSRLGAAAEMPRFAWREENSPRGMTNLSLASSGGIIYIGGDYGTLARTTTTAWGLGGAGSFAWEPSPPKVIGSERNHRMAVMGDNLVTTVYLDTPCRVWYGSPTLGGEFTTASLAGLGITEIFTGIRDIGEGQGVLFGVGGLVRMTTNSGVNFNARPKSPQPGWPLITDGTAFDGRLVMVSENGTVMSASIPKDIAIGPWSWTTNRITTNALRSVAVTTDGLLAVGGGGTAFLMARGGTTWQPVTFPRAGMLARNWLYVDAPTNGTLAGTLVLVATDGSFVGAPAHPKPLLASPQPVVTTCEDAPVSSLSFLAALDPKDAWSRFAQIDWYANGTQIATNSPSLPLRQTSPGRYLYQAVTRDLRTGIGSEPLTVEHVVTSLPAEPRTPLAGGVLRQCRSEGAIPLAVLPTEGITHEWYLAPNGGKPVAQGDQHTPAQAVTTSYYVEAVRREGEVACRSRTRLRIDHLVYENPSVPVPTVPAVTVAECDGIPLLSVQSVPRVQFVWYEKLAGQSKVVATNAAYRPALLKSATFEVEAVSEQTGCRSIGRATLSLVVRPVIELAPIKEMRVPPQFTNKAVVLTAVPSQPLTESHSLVWTTSGDGTFSSTQSLQTEYRPGTNDLALGSVALRVRLVDALAACAAREVTAGIRYLPVPVLTLATDPSGQRRVEWPPTPGWRLQSSGNILFDPFKDEADGELGIHLIGSDVGQVFYRLATQP